MLASRRVIDFNFWPAYADLAMVTIFVLLLFLLTQFVMNTRLLTTEVLRVVEAEEQHFGRREAERRQATIRALFTDKPGVIRVEEDGNLQIFTFSADALFQSDDARLSPAGLALMTQFGNILSTHSEYYTRIEVEGHADDSPSRIFYRRADGASDHGNWRLSVERAMTVVQRFQELGIGGNRLAVVGRSFYEPAAKDPSVDSKQRTAVQAQNRRVKIRLFYSERA